MKRVLSFAAIYIVSMILGTFCFATLFMFSCNLMMFVTGLPASFFSLHYFMTGIFLSVPLVCALIQILFILYTIRHPKNQFVSLVMYLLLGVVSWLVLIPMDLELINRYESDTVSARVEASSAGVFRKEASGIFYFSRIEDDGTADGVFIDTEGALNREGAVVPLFDFTVKNGSAFPYSDILVKDSLQPPELVMYPMQVYSALLTAAQYSASLGFFNWLAFASLGFALLSVYGLQFMSSWKLASVTCAVTAAAVIVFANYLYYMNILPSVFKEVAEKLSELIGVKDPLIVLANLIIAALLAVFGVFMGIYRLRGASVLENEE